MPESLFESSFQHFLNEINLYTDLLDTVTKIPKKITPHEKQELYEAFVLKVQVTWELLVEDILIACLNCDTTQYAKDKAISLPKKLSRNTCKCLLSGLGFFTYQGMAHIRGIAKKNLVSKHNPFSKISRENATRIDEFLKLRNYIAHKSQKSQQSLMKIYKSAYRLKNFQKPGAFLLAHDRQTDQVRFANYIDALNNGALEMAEFLEGEH